MPGTGRAGLRRQSQTVDEIAHRAIRARQHEQFQDRLVTVVCGQIRPEVVVDRAVLLLWELRGEPLTFRALQAACDTNPGSLNTRRKELREVEPSTTTRADTG